METLEIDICKPATEINSAIDTECGAKTIEEIAKAESGNENRKVSNGSPFLVRKFIKKHPILYTKLRTHGILFPKRKAKKVKGFKKYFNPGVAVKLLPLALTLSPDFSGMFAEGFEIEAMMEYTCESVSELYNTVCDKVSDFFGATTKEEELSDEKEAALASSSHSGTMAALGGLGKCVNMKQVRESLKTVVPGLHSPLLTLISRLHSN